MYRLSLKSTSLGQLHALHKLWVVWGLGSQNAYCAYMICCFEACDQIWRLRTLVCFIGSQVVILIMWISCVNVISEAIKDLRVILCTGIATWRIL
jgi:hypothetical protein